MARNRRGRIFNLFKDSFKISFYHKPTYELGDIQHYIILNDILSIKMREINDMLIIDDMIPLTKTYMVSLYDTIGNLLMNQTQFTVLISLLGNTSEFYPTCTKLGVPVVEDNQFINVSRVLYEKLKVYFENDVTKYGFYLLAVREPDELDSMQGPTICDKFISSIKEISDSIEIHKLLSDELVQVTLPNQYDCKCEFMPTMLHIRDFNIPDSTNFLRIMEFVEFLESFLPICPDIIMDVTSYQLNLICEKKKYQLIQDNNTIHNQFVKSLCHQGFGTYKIVQVDQTIQQI